MQIGLCTFSSVSSMRFPDLAVAAEERGFESIWVAEHSHIPASRRTPFPGGGELPEMYYAAMDPFVALATAASVTRTLKLGTGVCLLIQRDPIQTAKEVASLDQLSQGRFLFGIGGGWNVEEMENHGTRFDKRFQILRERVEAMKAIWTEEQAAYHGEFVDFDPIFAWPKPLQKPHPPIHVGGAFPGAVKRAIRYGDGWIPVGDPQGALARMPELRKLAEEAGRDPASIEVSIYYCPPDRDLLARLRDGGIARAIFGVPSESREKVLPILDHYRTVVQQLG
jgi:probable F420-dependent oxidoreductase